MYCVATPLAAPVRIWPEIIGLDQREQGAGFAVVKADVKFGALARGAVGLVAHDAERLRRPGQNVQHGVIGLARVRGIFCASSSACLRKTCSTASRAMSIVNRRRTSSSVSSNTAMVALQNVRDRTS